MNVLCGSVYTGQPKEKYTIDVFSEVEIRMSTVPMETPLAIECSEGGGGSHYRVRVFRIFGTLRAPRILEPPKQILVTNIYPIYPNSDLF